MKFSLKFLIFVFMVLIFTLGVNILALKYFTTEYFSEYLTTIKREVPDINFDLLTAFTNTKNLDEATINEYKSILGDLSNISRSLENFSKNPGAYAPSIINSLQKIGVPENSIERVLLINAINSFFNNIFNFSFLRNTTPEGHFVMRILRSMLIVNTALIISILAISWAWVRFSFRPIQSIVENLSDIINRRTYKKLLYKKKDEFGALISAINSLNENLSYQKKIRSDFLSDISHEIKTPITAIKCYLEGMDDHVIETNEQNRKLLHAEIDRLIKITGSIMEYEKLEQQDIASLKIEPIDITELVSNIRDEYQPMLMKNNQMVVLSSKNPFLVSMDRNKCVQLLHNIFSNFIKYAGEGTLLAVKFTRKNHIAFLHFVDNGKGVEENEIAFVKEKFYQIEKSRSGSSKNGLGIGLSIIEKIVRMHDGAFSIESATDRGFDIKISIPN